MTEKVIVITTDNRALVKELEAKDSSILEGLQKIVGGNIEVVNPVNLPDPFCFVCNEEGRILNLPGNKAASLLYGILFHGEYIAGNAVLMKRGYRNGEPDIVGLSDAELEDLLDRLAFDFSFLCFAYIKEAAGNGGA